jgi:rod shape-determining protein MreC
MSEHKARWDYVSAEADVRVGDRIMTSGLDGIFPKGLTIGIVKRIRDSGKDKGRLFQTIEIQPAVDFSKLETVLVVNSKFDRVSDDA